MKINYLFINNSSDRYTVSSGAGKDLCCLSQGQNCSGQFSCSSVTDCYIHIHGRSKFLITRRTNLLMVTPKLDATVGTVKVSQGGKPLQASVLPASDNQYKYILNPLDDEVEVEFTLLQ